MDELKGKQKQLDANNDGQISGEDFKLLREQKQEGGSMDDQMQMVMNQPMLPDEEMEDNYLDFIIDEALDEEEEGKGLNDFLLQVGSEDNHKVNKEQQSL